MLKFKLNFSLLQLCVISVLLVALQVDASHFICKVFQDNGKAKQICQKVCDDNCPNGICNYTKGGCVCRPGAHLENGKCTLDCAKGCPDHASCVAGSNECRCQTGYVQQDDGSCVAYCKNGCGERKFCAAPDTCHCKEHYVAKGDECAPVCSKGCVKYADCVAPDRCECTAGYQLAKKGGQCEPVCDAARCGNATCVAPGRCACLMGYGRASEGELCAPQCTGGCGEHGICVAPERCICAHGYQRVDGVCKPKCTTACDANAHCVRPDVCECVAGYALQTLAAGSRCLPVCAQGCPSSAYCAAPDHCQCVVGHAMVNGSCAPLCRQMCGPHRSCVAPDTCRCNTGYSEHNGDCLEQSVVTAKLEKCLKEMNLLFVKMHVSCDTGPFVMYLVYGAVVGLSMSVVLVTYKGAKHFRRGCGSANSVENGNGGGNNNRQPLDYVITYQPCSEPQLDGNEQMRANTSNYVDANAAPPAYDTLRKKC